MGEDDLKDKQQSFYEDARLGAFPIGRAAIFACYSSWVTICAQIIIQTNLKLELST